MAAAPEPPPFPLHHPPLPPDMASLASAPPLEEVAAEHSEESLPLVRAASAAGAAAWAAACNIAGYLDGVPAALAGHLRVAAETAGVAAKAVAGHAAEAARATATEGITAYATSCAARGTEYFLDRAKVKARRLVLPDALHARIPQYWRGFDVASGRRVQAVPARRMRPALEGVLRPGGTLGGRDQRYPHPEGYRELRYAGGWRIENPTLFAKYAAERDNLQSVLRSARAAGASVPKPGLREELGEATGALPAELNEEVNEVWLLHGTSPEVILQILTTGFNERLCGGLFGKGAYFAEDVAKVDQYAMPDKDYRDAREGRGAGDSMYDLHQLLYPDGEASHPQDVFYVLVCRVLLGAFARTLDGERRLLRDEEGGGATATPTSAGRTAPLWSRGTPTGTEGRELTAIPGTSPAEPFHALVAELGGRVVRFREFITFHAETRAYPEYIVAYKRVPPRLP